MSCGFKTDEPLAGCVACAASNQCATSSTACQNDMDCQSFEMCIGGCSLSDPSCISMCRALFSGGASLFDGFLHCAVCDTCPVACATSPVLALAQCGGSGGSGGAGGTSAGGSGGVGSP
jgi:hypothetical protein